MAEASSSSSSSSGGGGALPSSASSSTLTAGLWLQSINAIVGVLLIAVGVAALQSQVSSAHSSLSVWVLVLALLLVCAEAHTLLPGATALRMPQNFGFAFTPGGRLALFAFTGGLACSLEGQMGYVLGLTLCALGLPNGVFFFSHPNYMADVNEAKVRDAEVLAEELERERAEEREAAEAAAGGGGGSGHAAGAGADAVLPTDESGWWRSVSRASEAQVQKTPGIVQL